MLLTLISACSAFALPLFSPPQQEQRLLRVFAADVTKRTGVLVTTNAIVGGEAVSVPRIDEITPENLEMHLRVVVARMSLSSRLIKLNLPKGLTWTAEELLAYARAEAALFRKPLTDARDDVVEILARPLTKEQAKPAVEALGLRPVYVIAMKEGFFGGVWDTTYGQMRLVQKGAKVTGTYETNSGVIEGVVRGNTLYVTWFEQGNGTGGSAAYEMSDDGSSFSGPWYNNSNPDAQAGVWTGRRLRTPHTNDPPPMN